MLHECDRKVVSNTRIGKYPGTIINLPINEKHE
jgi:hypothetical protein